MMKRLLLSEDEICFKNAFIEVEEALEVSRENSDVIESRKERHCRHLLCMRDPSVRDWNSLVYTHEQRCCTHFRHENWLRRSPYAWRTHISRESTAA